LCFSQPWLWEAPSSGGGTIYSILWGTVTNLPILTLHVTEWWDWVVQWATDLQAYFWRDWGNYEKSVRITRVTAKDSNRSNLICGSIYSGSNFPTFRRKLLPPSSV
jgi:hypothetical protein